MTLQLAAPVAVLPILLYNGQRGRALNKYVFYWVYPIHLLLLFFLRRFLM